MINRTYNKSKKNVQMIYIELGFQELLKNKTKQL